LLDFIERAARPTESWGYYYSHSVHATGYTTLINFEKLS